MIYTLRRHEHPELTTEQLKAYYEAFQLLFGPSTLQIGGTWAREDVSTSVKDSVQAEIVHKKPQYEDWSIRSGWNAHIVSIDEGEVEVEIYGQFTVHVPLIGSDGEGYQFIRIIGGD